MRTTDSITKNMPDQFRDFYVDHIDFIKKSIEEYYPKHVDKENFEDITGLPEIYPQDYSTLYESTFLTTQEYLDRGGKVLRPILVALCLEAYGAKSEDFGPVFGAIEAMEDSSIMMDDYIDNSLERRGGPCAHIHHGYPLANISSCTAFSIVHKLFYNNDLNLPEDKVNRILNAQAWEKIQMGFGQIIELYWTESNVNDVTVDKYFQETVSRCAFLTFRGPMFYAGILANAPEQDLERLKRIGEYMLVGYHLKGDDLDMSPDSPVWGKIAGEDITTGRRTILMNYILQNAPDDKRKVLEEIISSRTDDEDKKKIVYQMVMEFNVFDFTKGLAKKYNKLAKDEIDQLTISDNFKELMYQFADYATNKRTL